MSDSGDHIEQHRAETNNAIFGIVMCFLCATVHVFGAGYIMIRNGGLAAIASISAVLLLSMTILVLSIKARKREVARIGDDVLPDDPGARAVVEQSRKAR